MEQSNDNDVMKQKLASMAQEADGFYKQTVTVCSFFMIGSLAIAGKPFLNDPLCNKWLLWAAWFFLSYPLLLLTTIRWNNVEAHRKIVEILKPENKSKIAENKIVFDRVEKQQERDRKLTCTSIISMGTGIVLLAIYIGVNMNN